MRSLPIVVLMCLSLVSIGYSQITSAAFAPPTDLISYTGDSIYQPTFFDVDLDGDLDFFSVMQNLVTYDETLIWSRNLGGGAFDTPITITSIQGVPSTVAFADINSDGYPDIVGKDPTAFPSNRLIWIENLGGLGFGPPETIGEYTQFSYLEIKGFADLNADGFSDIILSSDVGMIIMFGSSSPLSWTLVTLPPPGTNPTILSVATDDADQDGDLDIFYSVTGSSNPGYVVENLGGGSFSMAVGVANITPSGREMRFVDMDNDGLKDLVSYDYSGVYAHKSLGSLAFNTPSVIAIPSGYVNWLQCPDINEDGLPEIAFTANTWDRDVYVCENQGAMTFAPASSIYHNIDGTSGMWMIDADGDNGIDCVTCNFQFNSWHIDPPVSCRNLDGVFGPKQPITTSANGPTSVTARDLNGDGLVDALFTTMNDGRVAWSENLGGGVFGPKQTIDTLLTYVFDALAEDFDNDGDMDIVVASASDDSIYSYENLGAGVFGSAILVTNQADSVRRIHAADIDADGDLDLFSASSDDHKIALYLNAGNGTFGSQQVLSTQCLGATSVKAGDIDGDGDLDLAVASSGDGKIAWFQNLGSASFGPEQIITTTCVSAQDVALCDVDGDGDLDAITASFANNRIAWHENNGLGAFGSENTISDEAYGVMELHTVDHNQDGSEDLFAALRLIPQVAWFDNLGAASISNGNGAFSSRHLLRPTTVSPYSVTSADVDLDGRPDIISASYDDNTIAWFANRDTEPTPGQPQPEDFYMLTLVNGQGDPYASSKSAVANNLLSITLDTPGGSFLGAVPFLLGQIFDPNLSTPLSHPLFPSLQVEVTNPQTVVLLNGINAGALGNINLGPTPLTLHFTIPVGLTGFSIRLQGLAYLSAVASNGFFATSQICDLQFN